MANNKRETKQILKDFERKSVMAQENKDIKFYQYEEEVNGTKYVFQYCGKRRALQITDEATMGEKRVSKEKLMDLMLKEIVVSPTVDLDYFDLEEYMDDFDRVIEIASIIFNGKFRNNKELQQK